MNTSAPLIGGTASTARSQNPLTSAGSGSPCRPALVSQAFNATMRSSAIMLISGSNRVHLLPAHDRCPTGQILFVHVCAPLIKRKQRCKTRTSCCGCIQGRLSAIRQFPVVDSILDREYL